ncbi:MAG: ATP-dependent DNA helicase RecG [Proteobacteria bacterium]|nr:ATP-dependent DNA helicase RecG [Pseudomonadota bacterium]
MNSEVISCLLAIKRPLQYASRNAYKNLPKIKDLHIVIPELLFEAKLKAGNIAISEIEGIKEQFISFDSLSLDEKHKRIDSALSSLEGLIEKLGDIIDVPVDCNETVPTAGSCSISSKSLNTPIQYIKGVGPKIASLLARRGIKTIEEALYLFPHRYDDRRNLRKVAQLRAGEVQQVTGDVLATGEVMLSARRKIFEVIIGDGTGTLTLKWFNYNKKYIQSLYPEGCRILASGEVKLYSGSKEIIHPDTEILEAGEDELASFKRILPVYPLTEGLSQKVMRKIMARVLADFIDDIVDGIPESIRYQRQLLPLKEAMKEVHFPSNDADLDALMAKKTASHKGLVYDEFFFLELGIAMRRRGIETRKGVEMKSTGRLKSKLLEILPFNLTGAQKRVIGEIETDLTLPSPMHRLLQGDVGCGKTIVALVSALYAVEEGYQVAIMAPTEILAEQHYINMRSFAEKLGIKTELIRGSLKGKEKKEVIETIAKGDIELIVGTHALIQEGVSFKRLGLGIIDEQHRFGVVQRAKLGEMGCGGIAPNILVMTATPIPRSLAMTVYGDLELSVIDELPPGRQEIKTKVFHERDRAKVYKLIESELKKGRQAYIVYPLVDESEKMELMDATGMAEELQTVFKNYKVGLIHGRMKVDEKESVMAAFKDGLINLLVSTTVIEVGIDVPNATIMVIEHAERFGLSQLHQLRGRVGRGNDTSICVLLAQYRKSDEARERLRVMENFTSGFDISEADLKIRGPGDFLGTRQSGMPDFRIGNILKDERILKASRDDAFSVIEKDPKLSLPENRLLKSVLEDRWKGRLELAGVG